MTPSGQKAQQAWKSACEAAVSVKETRHSPGPSKVCAYPATQSECKSGSLGGRQNPAFIFRSNGREEGLGRHVASN